MNDIKTDTISYATESQLYQLYTSLINTLYLHVYLLRYSTEALEWIFDYESKILHQ